MFRLYILGLNFLKSLKIMISICYFKILSLAVKQLIKQASLIFNLMVGPQSVDLPIPRSELLNMALSTSIMDTIIKCDDYINQPN